MSTLTARTLPAIAGIAISLVGGTASAQGMGGPGGGGPPMPMALDIKKVAVGSWGDYSIALQQMPPMKMRFALVKRDGAVSTIEMIVEGGMMAMMGGKMAMAITSDGDPSNPDSVKKAVMQMGESDPVEMPAKGGSGTERRPFKGLDPKKLVGKEDVKVAAGSFRTEHYHDTGEDGATVDSWVSKDVSPIGLVKMTITPAAGRADTAKAAGKGKGKGPMRRGPGAAGPMTFELQAVGKDAKPTITRPAKPFDQGAFMRSMMGAGGPGGPGGPGGAPSGVSGAPKPAAAAAPGASAAPAAPAASAPAEGKKKK